MVNLLYAPVICRKISTAHHTVKIHDDVIKIFSALLSLCEGNPPVTDGFPSQRPVTWSFDVFFHLHPNKRLNNQSRCRWFEWPLCSLWRHCDVHLYKDSDIITRSVQTEGSSWHQAFLRRFVGLPSTCRGQNNALHNTVWATLAHHVSLTSFYFMLNM